MEHVSFNSKETDELQRVPASSSGTPHDYSGAVSLFDAGGLLSAGTSGPSSTAIHRVPSSFSHANFRSW